MARSILTLISDCDLLMPFADTIYLESFLGGSVPLTVSDLEDREKTFCMKAGGVPDISAGPRTSCPCMTYRYVWTAGL